MKKKSQSIKGAACSNTRACNVGYSDSHNLRQSPTSEISTNPNTNIYTELIEENTTWIDPSVPNLRALDKSIRQDYAQTPRYKEYPKGSGQMVEYFREMPSKGKTASSPLKETILLLPHNGKKTDEMVKNFIARCEKEFGVKCVRFFVHRDEQYTNPDTGETHINNHAHIVWNFYNYQKHEINKLGKEQMRLMNDWASEYTGMQRGRDARQTGAEHLSVIEYKNKKEQERTERLQKNKNKVREKIWATLSRGQTEIEEDNKKIIEENSTLKAKISDLEDSLVRTKEKLRFTEEDLAEEKNNTRKIVLQYEKKINSLQDEIKIEKKRFLDFFKVTSKALKTMYDYFSSHQNVTDILDKILGNFIVPFKKDWENQVQVHKRKNGPKL
jgi:hypothetical protein